MTDVLLLLHILAACLALAARDLLVTIITMAVFSLLSALLLFFLHAPDVALTEAAVGAGLSTVIYVWIVRRTQRKDTR